MGHLRPDAGRLARTALIVVAAAAAVSADQDRRTWRDYGGSPDNSHFVPSKQIDKTNVNRLEIVWNYPYGETGFNPIVVRGVVYGRGRNNALVALDAATGRELWIHDGLIGLTRRGVNYWESRDGRDRRLIFSAGDYLQEIDASTGRSIPAFGANGVVDLRDGLGRDPATVTRIQSNSPGKIFENLILLGSATGEAYMSPPGDLRAYDVVSGKLVWQFHTVPHPGEPGYDTWPKDAWRYIGGTNTWGEITLDADRGIAYFPTGSGTYDFYGADRIGKNLFANCLLALDARTGKLVWYYQTVHHDLWDYDNTSAPQLTTIRHNGRRVDVVALAGKTGFLYVFNRATGEPIWPIEERPVPTRTDVPGEQPWSTQPFPTVVPPFGRQSFTLDDLSPYLRPADREQFAARIRNARNEGLFTPIGFTDTIHMPGNNGGSNWGSTAAHPTDGTVYVENIDVPAIIRLLTEEEQAKVFAEAAAGGRGRGAGGGGAAVAAQGDPGANVEAPPAAATTAGPPSPASSGPVVASGPIVSRPARAGGAGRGAPPPQYPAGLDAPSRRFFTDGYGLYPQIVKPPFSTLTAYDLNAGTIKWQIPLGDDPRLLREGITGTGQSNTPRVGIIPTAAGLVFVNDGNSRVHAYDADTGRSLWEFAFGAPTSGSGAMYEWSGRQYLLMAASGGNANAAGDRPRGYAAFALRK